MFTPEDRDRIRSQLLAAARDDARIGGAAITGSGAAGREDRWSDIDLAFGVRDASAFAATLADWTARMYDEYGALHHCDVASGAWIYRVFLLANTLQVDLAFAPSSEFGARAPTFRLVFGSAADLPAAPPPATEPMIGLAWLYALHARSSIERGRLWQAEYMVSALRDQVLALACVRHGLPAAQGRGMDRLPDDVTRPLQAAVVHAVDAIEISRAFRVAIAGLIAEIRHADAALADRIAGTLVELAGD